MGRVDQDDESLCQCYDDPPAQNTLSTHLFIHEPDLAPRIPPVLLEDATKRPPLQLAERANDSPGSMPALVAHDNGRVGGRLHEKVQRLEDQFLCDGFPSGGSDADRRGRRDDGTCAARRVALTALPLVVVWIAKVVEVYLVCLTEGEAGYERMQANHIQV